MHSKYPSFSIFCGVGGCWEVFTVRHRRSDLGNPDAETPIFSQLDLTGHSLLADPIESEEQH